MNWVEADNIATGVPVNFHLRNPYDGNLHLGILVLGILMETVRCYLSSNGDAVDNSLQEVGHIEGNRCTYRLPFSFIINGLNCTTGPCN